MPLASIGSFALFWSKEKPVPHRRQSSFSISLKPAHDESYTGDYYFQLFLYKNRAEAKRNKVAIRRIRARSVLFCLKNSLGRPCKIQSYTGSQLLGKFLYKIWAPKAKSSSISANIWANSTHTASKSIKLYRKPPFSIFSV